MTCIILSGGKSLRAGGRDKAFLTIDGESFIERKIRQLSPLFKELIIIVRDIEPYRYLPVQIVADQVPEQGPLMGLYSGLRKSISDINFVTTVDSPFTNPDLIAWLVDEIGDYDAHVPRHGSYTEPLFAVYRKSCIPFIEQTLSQGRVISFYRYIRMKYAEEEIIRTLDPEFRSFVNINSLDEYQRFLDNFPDTSSETKSDMNSRIISEASSSCPK